MRPSKIIIRKVAVVVGAALALVPFSGAADAADWHVDQVPLPNGTSTATLSGVAPVAPNDVWAVGRTNNGAVINHWDGSRWSEVTSPAGQTGALTSISAAAANDVIAVGADYPVPVPGVAGGPVPRAAHWDGSTWNRMTLPANLQGDTLTDVTMLSSTNAWAVGTGPLGTLALHWNGSTWSTTPTPNPTSVDSRLRVRAVAGTAAGDVWAVGGQRGPRRAGYSGTNAPFVIHYDGHAWTEVPVPAIGSDFLVDVAALTPTNAWALSSGGSVVHWDGTSWSVTTKLSQPAQTTLTAVSPTDIWATGSGSNSLLNHFDGSTWVSEPKPAGADNLVGSASLASGNVWFVGGTGPAVVLSTSAG